MGFPGEHEEDFQQLLDFVDEAQIDHVGVFRYSQEEGTTAGTLPNQVPDEVKQERWHRLMERQAVVVRRKNLALIGSEQQVLVCGHDDRWSCCGSHLWAGARHDGVVYINRTAARSVKSSSRIYAASGYDLRATPLPLPQIELAKPIDFTERAL